jgi:multiple RNA-binding domain-containing protein 1
MAASSRIFIRNLPPSLSDSEFRSHFSRGQQDDITDARFFPNRRIGYVGFKSAEEAVAAVKFFNKSFIRLSRIAVELATPYDESESIKRKRGSESEKVEKSNEQQDNPLKRKREGEQKAVEKDPKLNEFLKVMRAPNKTRTWQNEVTDGVENVVVPPNDAEDSTDEEIQVISASRPSESLPNGIDVDGGDQSEKGEEIKPRTSNPNQSDDAWLRSRTTGLLDMDADIAHDENHDDDDENENEEDEDSQDAITKPTTKGSGSNPESASIEKNNEHSQDPITEPETPEDKIKEHGRLYLRNLPFKTTENDLRAHFSSFGALDEVSIHLNSLTPSLLS